MGVISGFRTKARGLSLFRSGFARNIAILSSGTAIAQLIPILLSPILTRLYAPEDFGLWAVYVAIVGILSIIAAGRYELAIMLVDREEEADALVLLSIAIAFGFSLVCLLVALVFAAELEMLAGQSGSRLWLYAAPLGIFVTTAYLALNYWLNRHKRFGLMSRNRIVQAGAGGGVSIAFGLTGLRSIGLIGGQLIGQVLTVLTIAREFLRRPGERPPRAELRRTMGDLARRYRHHPMHLLPAHWVTTAASYLPMLAISAVYGIAEAGFFLMAFRTISLPSTVIADAVGDVYRQEASVLYREAGHFRALFVRTVGVSAMMAVVPVIVLIVIAPTLFAFVFGEAWRVSGDYARILAISAFFQFVFTPVDKGAIIVGATRYIFLWCLSRLILTGGLCVAAFVYRFDMVWFVMALTAVNMLMYAVDGVVEYVLSGMRERRHVKA